MKKIKSFENFNESLGKFSTYMNSLIKRGGKLASDVWDATKVEGEETKIAVGILSRMVKGEEVSEKEKRFLKEQSKDLARIIPLVAISGIPIPVPIKAKWAVMGLIAMDVFGGVVSVQRDNIAHFAHLGGALIGFILVLYWNKNNKKSFY